MEFKMSNINYYKIMRLIRIEVKLIIIKYEVKSKLIIIKLQFDQNLSELRRI